MIENVTLYFEHVAVLQCCNFDRYCAFFEYIVVMEGIWRLETNERFFIVNICSQKFKISKTSKLNINSKPMIIFKNHESSTKTPKYYFENPTKNPNIQLIQQMRSPSKKLSTFNNFKIHIKCGILENKNFNNSIIRRTRCNWIIWWRSFSIFE